MEIKNLSGNVIKIIDRKTLTRADLTHADLSRADLSGANLSRANLSGANLTRADLTHADLSRADLSGANLSGANLSGANLSGANLSGANLTGANLTGANLYGVIHLTPTIMLLCSWDICSDSLTIDLMRYDSDNHPNPQKFIEWADGGDCPYDSEKMRRCADFMESRNLLKSVKDTFLKLKPKSALELMTMLITEKCKNEKT
jgi:hypothetical protein